VISYMPFMAHLIGSKQSKIEFIWEKKTLFDWDEWEC